MSSFYQELDSESFDEIKSFIDATTSEEVGKALLSKIEGDLSAFAKLLSPVAEAHLELMASQAHFLTKERFGNIINLYAPLYLSNECQNICTYCGFSLGNKIIRKTLTDAEIMAEAEHLSNLGFSHVLLVTGESRNVGVPYLLNAIKLIKSTFSSIIIEVQPLEIQDYSKLKEAGVYGVLVYQETYNQESYAQHHPKGHKKDFFYRLETPERIAQAGLQSIGLGALLGLSDWRVDAYILAKHLKWLRHQYPNMAFSISFPRLRPAEGVGEPAHLTTSKNLVQLITAFRLFDPHVELSLSTRESAKFRDHAFKLGITTMSAGSKTDPGGYTAQGDTHALAQFEIDDTRTPNEVSEMLISQGYQPVWKAWDRSLMGLN